MTPQEVLEETLEKRNQSTSFSKWVLYDIVSLCCLTRRDNATAIIAMLEHRRQRLQGSEINEIFSEYIEKLRQSK